MRLLGTVVHALLGSAPAAVVGRTRTARRSAGPIERAVAVAARPLYGRPWAIRTGAGTGLLLRGERRSVAWLTGKVEPEVQRALIRHLRPGATFVDVGAGIGFFTVLCARQVGPEGSVVAFEPGPANAAAVRANAGLNGLANVRVVVSAVSSHEGSAFLAGAEAPTATLTEQPSAGAVPVRTTSLDAFLEGEPGLVPDLIKIDVEGHEAAVVHGMAGTLARHRPHVVVELHGDTAVVGLLADAGYRTTLLERAPSLEAARAWGHVLAAPDDAAAS